MDGIEIPLVQSPLASRCSDQRGVLASASSASSVNVATILGSSTECRRSDASSDGSYRRRRHPLVALSPRSADGADDVEEPDHTFADAVVLEADVPACPQPFIAAG